MIPNFKNGTKIAKMPRNVPDLIEAPLQKTTLLSTPELRKSLKLAAVISSTHTLFFGKANLQTWLRRHAKTCFVQKGA